MRDAPASPLRRSLWPLSFVYRVATALRNIAFDRGILTAHTIGVPVISVGNLTVGGTGKTPLVTWLVDEALRVGRRPGVLARGYGRAPGASLNDEGELLAARHPGVPQVQDPDRVAAGRRLVAEHDVDVVVLDDGFQHRRLRRDRDLVCLDAKRPFGPGGLLPAGDLREAARAALRRADLVVLTHAERFDDPDAVVARADQLREFVRGDLPVFACRHRPSDVVELRGGRSVGVDALQERRVLLASAIAKPERFRDTAVELGAEVVGEVARRDHHRYTAEDAAELARRASDAGATLVTTEKDAVKLRWFDLDALVVRIDLEWLGQSPSPAEVGLV